MIKIDSYLRHRLLLKLHGWSHCEGLSYRWNHGWFMLENLVFGSVETYDIALDFKMFGFSYKLILELKITSFSSFEESWHPVWNCRSLFRVWLEEEQSSLNIKALCANIWFFVLDFQMRFWTLKYQVSVLPLIKLLNDISFLVLIVKACH